MGTVLGDLWINDDVSSSTAISSSHATHNNRRVASLGKTSWSQGTCSTSNTIMTITTGRALVWTPERLAEPSGPQFEGRLRATKSRELAKRFVVFTWVDGQMLWPELVPVHARKIEFRSHDH